MLANALAEGRVRPAIAFWASVLALTCTLLQSITMTEKQREPRPRVK